MPLRRRAATLVAAVFALTALTAPAALAAAPAAGLYGASDPTYDGVWRQSYALLALHTEGTAPAASAVGWLTAQQCADGGFPSYRADTAKACAPKAEDTNATGIAVQALAALGGRPGAVAKAAGWLRSVQNADGGWSYNPGGASDPDSTAVVLGAFAATGVAPRSVTARSGKSPFDALRGFQAGCAAKAANRGAFAYPTNGRLSVNAKATADAVRASQGAGFVVDPAAAPAASGGAAATAAPDCASGDPYASLDPKSSGDVGAAWLAAQLTAGGGRLTALTPGADKPAPDYGTTADAVVALAASGRRAAAASAYGWLAANAGSWARQNPAALAQLILAAHATGANPRKAGGADLVRQLTNLGPAPASQATASGPAPASSAAPAEHKKDGGSSVPTWLIVGVIFVASIGFGLLVGARKRQRR